MKNLKRFVLAVAAVLAVTVSASAQFAFGIKAGMNVNSVHFNNTSDLISNFDTDNRTGYTAGITAEFTVPIIGLGFDASLMYVHRLNEGEASNNLGDEFSSILNDEDFRKQDFIELPINLKYKFSLPVVSYIVKPYIYTGPSFAFLCSKQAVTDAYKSKKFDTSWNVGGGVELINHIQIGVNYGWGMTKALQYVVVGNEEANLGKAKTWTITAAYFF